MFLKDVKSFSSLLSPLRLVSPSLSKRQFMIKLTCGIQMAPLTSEFTSAAVDWA